MTILWVSQGTNGFATGSGTTASGNITVTLQQAPVSGDTLILVFVSSAGTVNPNVTGVTSTNTTWNKANAENSSTTNDVEIWLGYASSSAGTTITVTVANGTGSNYGELVRVWEVNGLTSSPVDQSAVNAGSTSTTGNSGTTGTTVDAVELIVGAIGCAAESTSTCTQTVPTNNFIQGDGADVSFSSGTLQHMSLGAYFSVVSVKSTFNVSATLVNSVPWVGCIVTLIASSQTLPNQVISASNAASASISTAGYLAENIVYDSATGKYWWVYLDITGSYPNICIASASSPTGTWTVQGTPLVTGSSTFYLEAPFLVNFGGTWYLYFATNTSNSNNDNNQIYVYSSTTVNSGYSGTGITNPILTYGGSGAWDALRVDEPFVILVSSTYYLFYMGQNVGTSGGTTADPTSFELCGYATASSPTGTFTKYASNPIIPSTANYGYDMMQCKGADPWVIAIGGTYYLGFTGSTQSLNPPYFTIFYTTTDFVTFTYQAALLCPSGDADWDANGAFRGAVSYLGTTYYFPYTGVDSSGNYRMGETTLTVTSTQPLTFVQHWLW